LLPLRKSKSKSLSKSGSNTPNQPAIPEPIIQRHKPFNHSEIERTSNFELPTSNFEQGKAFHSIRWGNFAICSAPAPLSAATCRIPPKVGQAACLSSLEEHRLAAYATLRPPANQFVRSWTLDVRISKSATRRPIGPMGPMGPMRHIGRIGAATAHNRNRDRYRYRDRMTSTNPRLQNSPFNVTNPSTIQK